MCIVRIVRDFTALGCLLNSKIEIISRFCRSIDTILNNSTKLSDYMNYSYFYLTIFLYSQYLKLAILELLKLMR